MSFEKVFDNCIIMYYNNYIKLNKKKGTNIMLITKTLRSQLNANKSDACLTAKTLIARSNKNDFLLGGALALIKENNLQTTEGYKATREDFMAYAEDELGLKPAKISSMIQVYTTLSQYEEITMDDIALLVVSKQRLVAQYVTEQNVIELVADAKWMTGEEIKAKYGVKKDGKATSQEEETNIVQFPVAVKDSTTIEFTIDEMQMLRDATEQNGYGVDVKTYILNTVMSEATYGHLSTDQQVFA